MGQSAVLGIAAPDIQSTSLSVTLCSHLMRFLHSHTIANTQLTFLAPQQRVDSLWVWRKDKRLQLLKVLQLHTVREWPSSSSDWGWNGVTEAGPPSSLLEAGTSCTSWTRVWCYLVTFISVTLQDEQPPFRTNLKCNRLLLKWYSSVRYQKLLKERFGMVWRKHSFTEHKNEEIKSATVPLGSLVWASLWPRLVNISRSLLLFKLYQQFLKKVQTSQYILIKHYFEHNLPS